MNEQFQKQIADATVRLAELQAEKASREASANAHEAAARADRLAMSDAKKEMEALNVVLRNTQIQSAQHTAVQATLQAQAASETAAKEAADLVSRLHVQAAELAEKSKAADATHAELKAALAKLAEAKPAG